MPISNFSQITSSSNTLVLLQTPRPPVYDSQRIPHLSDVFQITLNTQKCFIIKNGSCTSYFSSHVLSLLFMLSYLRFYYVLTTLLAPEQFPPSSLYFSSFHFFSLSFTFVHFLSLSFTSLFQLQLLPVLLFLFPFFQAFLTELFYDSAPHKTCFSRSDEYGEKLEITKFSKISESFHFFSLYFQISSFLLSNS